MRLINRLLAAILIVGLVVAGVLVVIEVVANRLTQGFVLVDWHPVYDWAARTSWMQGSVRVACMAIAVLGLLLLAAELRPGKPSRLRTTSDCTDAAYTRRGVAASIRTAVNDVDGINHTGVKVTRRTVKVAATTAGRQPYTAESLRQPAAESAQRRLDTLELSPPPKLAVRVTTRSR